MIVLWSPKGGCGTTVVAAALALVLAHTRSTVLVDLAGDAPAVLGLPEPAGPGIADWLASPSAPPESLVDLAVAVNDRLLLVPRGSCAVAPPGVTARWGALRDALDGEQVIIDAGVGAPPPGLVGAGDQSLLVIRSCYVAIRRAVALGVQPTGIVLVLEPGRPLGAADVERSLGAPVVAQVPYDPAIARRIDAGLLAGRLPRTLVHPLRRVA